MSKESFQPLEFFPEKKPEIFLEEQIDNLEKLKQEELEFFLEKEKEIDKEDPRKGAKNKAKLAAYLLITFIALGTAKEGLENRAIAQTIPEKKTEIVLEKTDADKLEKERLEDYQKLKKTIEEEKIAEKLDFLEKQYDGAIENFLSFQKISQTLSFLEKLEANLKKGDPNALVNKDFPRAMTLGSVISNFSRENWTVFNEKQKLEKSQEEITIKGFENFPGASNEEIKNLLQKYPKTWLQNSTKEIIYVPEIQKVDKRYVKGGEARPYGVSAMLEKDIRTPIKIFEIPQEHIKNSILETTLEVLHHEIAHNNDWESSQILSSQERINFLYDITQRYNSENRFKSSYVESIKIKDKFLESYIKTKEYWAEIMMNHLLYGEQFEASHPEDAKICQKWFNLINE